MARISFKISRFSQILYAMQRYDPKNGEGYFRSDEEFIKAFKAKYLTISRQAG